jgi:hypothetical protein
VLTSCSGAETITLDNVKSFDAKYGTTVNSLHDSLVKNVGTDTSYVFELRRDITESVFSYYHGGYFNPPFKLNKTQTEFMLHAAVGNIYYNKNYDAYVCKMFFFKSDDKTVWLVISRDSLSASSVGRFDSFVYSNQNRFYFVGDAWP